MVSEKKTFGLTQFWNLKEYDNLCEDALAFYNLIFTCSLISSTIGSVTFGFLEVNGDSYNMIQIVLNIQSVCNILQVVNFRSWS